jgi:hypothetical protein
MEVNSYSRFLEQADDVASFIPFASTVTNLVNLFQKCVILPLIEHNMIHLNPKFEHYYTYLKNKSFLRCFALLIPFLGNFIVAAYDVDKKWKDKAFVLDAVQFDGLLLRQANPKLRNDFDIVLAAVKQNGLALQYASEELRKNREIVKAAVLQNPLALAYSELKEDEGFVLELVKENCFAFVEVGSGPKGNPKIVLPVVERQGFLVQYANPWVRHNPKVMLAAVKQHGLALQYGSPWIKNQRVIVLEAVKQNGLALQYASRKLRNDPEIVRAAMRSAANAYSSVLRYAGDEITNDPLFMLDAIQQKALAIGYVGLKIRKEQNYMGFKDFKDFLIAAMGRNGLALEYVEQFQDDEDVVLAAVKQNGLALQFASERLRKNKKIVAAAVQQNVKALNFADRSLTQATEFMIELLQNKQQGYVSEPTGSDSNN